MSIIISKKGGEKRKLEKRTIGEEAKLQKYIFENPDVIPFDEIKENISFTVLDKEFPLNVGSIDVLGVDSEGDLYIIETKLYKDQDKRKVLAQVLDCGASLWGSYSGASDALIQELDKRVLEGTDAGSREKLLSKMPIKPMES